MDQPDKSKKEKREFERFPVSFTVLYTVKAPFPVRIRIGNSDCAAMAQDIGEGGMALSANLEIPFDTLLSINFIIINDAAFSKEDHAHNFELDAQVRYCVLVKESTYRLGVSFLNILPSERSYIANYIRINSLIRNPNV
jgi:c-di-GMP-binding flagellar brake protein YcgR